MQHMGSARFVTGVAKLPTSQRRMTIQRILLFRLLASQVQVHTEVKTYRPEKTNAALGDLRNGRFTGAAVVLPWGSG